MSLVAIWFMKLLRVERRKKRRSADKKIDVPTMPG
jgi:hypothetical protein